MVSGNATGNRHQFPLFPSLIWQMNPRVVAGPIDCTGAGATGAGATGGAAAGLGTGAPAGAAARGCPARIASKSCATCWCTCCRVLLSNEA